MSAQEHERSDETLERWLAEFVERRECGEALTPEAFCREHPEGGEALAHALRELCATDALFPTPASDLPEKVGAYRVLGQIGHGGMGRVLAVEHEDRPGQPLALKLLHFPLENQARALERFRREGRALERIEHAGVVRVVETGLIDRRPFIAMELVEGTSLAECLNRARTRVEKDGVAITEALELPGSGPRLRRAASLVAACARAIAAAHREGVLHRDVNPRNVLVRPSGEPVVIDFGLMRSSLDPTLTGSGDVLGTPQYMAPEQARGEDVDERTDVFGLGCLLYELLTLEPPRGAAGTLTLLRTAGSRPIPRVPRRSPDVPEDLAAIAYRATAFVARWRYGSADELALDLERWLRGESVAGRAPTAVERGFEFWLRHRLAVTAVLVAVVLGGVAWLARVGAGEDPERVAMRAMNRVVVPWLDGDLVRARELLAEFEAQAPDHPLREFMEALCHDDLNRTSDHPAVRALVAGERARREGRPRDAISQFATAWDVAPGYPLILLLTGLAELEAGEPARARGKLEPVALNFGASHTLHRSLATLYSQIGSHADTARALQAALQLRPDDAQAWQELARARLELGDIEGTLAAARNALRLAPDEARGAIEELARALDDKGAAGAAVELRAALGH